MDISIVLRTKNEGRSLGKTLCLIRRQAYTPRPELIIVDSGSTDDTLAIASREKDLRIINIPPAEFTYGRSLNTGIRAARGDVIVALSAHAFPCGKHWLDRLVRHFVDPKVAGVYGRQVPHDDAWPSVKRDYLEFYGNEIREQIDFENLGHHCFSNAASAFRRQWWQHRNFDENLPGCEDCEWARAMLRRGLKIIYDPTVKVYHSHNESLITLYRRSRRETIARKSIYKHQYDPSSWYRIWFKSISDDVTFIHRNREPKKWLIWVPIYRLFWALGRSPQPLWPNFMWRLL